MNALNCQRDIFNEETKGIVMLKKSLPLLLACLASSINAASFEAVVLGSKGGIQDGNLSAFMLKNESEKNYIMLDAGSVVNGLIVAEQQGAFSKINLPDDSPYNKVGYLLRDRISAYLISHAHLDHVAGMIIASPSDSQKPIYSLASTNKALANNYFNWSAWPNFGDSGVGYKLALYHYEDLTVNQFSPIVGSTLQVLALPLSHSGTESTAFVIKDKDDDLIVYFGDTGADSVEESTNLNQVWTLLAPYVKAGKLKAMIIETSFINGTPDELLFGHLTPKLLIEELSVLETLSGKGTLSDLDIVISHIKYSLQRGGDPKMIIAKQLNEANRFGVNFIIPKQGDSLLFE